MKSFKMLPFIVPFVLLAGGGCSYNGNSHTDQTTYNGPVHEVRQNLKPSSSAQPISSQEIARHLVVLSKKNSDVRDATAVIIGNQAIVGLDLDKDTDPDRVGTIKHTVSRALKKDPYGANAYVTADPDLVQRLNNLGTSIRNGKPVSGLRDEMTSIIERIMPETAHPASHSS